VTTTEESAGAHAGEVAPIDLATLTVDQLAAAAVGLRARMQTKIREAAQQIRDARPTPDGGLVEEDTYALMRSLGTAADALDAIAAAFTAAAKTARGEMLEDVVAVRGEAPRGLLRVPSPGGDLLVTPKWETPVAIATEEVTSVLVEVAWRNVVRDYLTPSDPGTGTPLVDPVGGVVVEGVASEQWPLVRAAALAGADVLAALLPYAGKWEPQTSKLKALRETLSRQGLDKLAGRLRRAETRRDVWKDAVTVTRDKPRG
jgi:hypothetical protein